MNEYQPEVNVNPPGSHPMTRIMVLLLLFLTVAVGFLLAERFNRRSDWVDATPRLVTPRGDLGADEKSTIELFQRCSSSVVHIINLGSRTAGRGEDPTVSGTGSGFVWDSQGHIVTNYHVVNGAVRPLVTFANHKSVEAEVVGVAPHKDLALLRVDIPPEALIPIAVGESGNLQVGQKVYAIGNPFGLDQTLTTGLISGLGREIRSTTQRPIVDVVQTDAAINPGNSGGPLLDSAGRLIGVNTAIASSNGTSDGVGFAIPVDTVQRVVPQLIKHQRLITPALRIVPVNSELSKRAGLDSGVLVKFLDPEGPAGKAGILPFRYDRYGHLVYGDLIVGIGETRINEIDDLYRKLEELSVGDTVSVHLIRYANTTLEEELTVNVQLGSDQ